ncbi:hypothetical protein Pla175_27760 [Pirellulimonas nuda]|uniref:Uncharacterized protein n=1 Tax=Pirellulimonas nuda TaxID=2528009 RepID=A0A518DD77_9BACT|nr:hypothetical protein [Pirellulimonas nuda]QDU89386.1 hypothetical protein Pla175_27760 [Pirellulimonas nuda]
MGWRTIGGEKYYYHTQRIGGVRVQVCCGAGEAGERAAQAVAQRVAARRRAAQMTAELRALDTRLERGRTDFGVALRAAALAAGMRYRNGVWRTQRSGTSAQPDDAAAPPAGADLHDAAAPMAPPSDAGVAATGALSNP